MTRFCHATLLSELFSSGGGGGIGGGDDPMSRVFSVVTQRSTHKRDYSVAGQHIKLQEAVEQQYFLFLSRKAIT